MAGFLKTPGSLADMSGRERRLVAVLILIAAIAAAWLLVLNPILSGFADRAARRDDYRRQYALGAAQVAALPRLVRVAERSKARMSDYLLTAPDADRAGLALEDRLRAVLEAAGGNYRGSAHAEVPAEAPPPPPVPSAGAAAPAPPPGLSAQQADIWAQQPRVTASIDARMSRAQLIRFLNLLQSTPPWLVVDTLSVTADAAAALNQDPDIDVSVAVSMAYVAG